MRSFIFKTPFKRRELKLIASSNRRDFCHFMQNCMYTVIVISSCLLKVYTFAYHNFVCTGGEKFSQLRGVSMNWNNKVQQLYIQRLFEKSCTKTLSCLRYLLLGKKNMCYSL